jgi:serine/threonine protein kinase
VRDLNREMFDLPPVYLFELIHFLSQRIESKGCIHPDPEIVRVRLRELVDGLVFLHALRIIHRDLKPQNVLVAPDGR